MSLQCVEMKELKEQLHEKEIKIIQKDNELNVLQRNLHGLEDFQVCLLN